MTDTPLKKEPGCCADANDFLAWFDDDNGNMRWEFEGWTIWFCPFCGAKLKEPK